LSDQESAPLLLVDDDPDLLQLLFDELQGAGHRCVGVNNGQDALMHLRRGHFALVVLDWTLPDFSGVEICRRLRSSGNTTPVLMVTARDALEERVAALDAGADDYLTKPFELEELQARVRAQLRRRGYAAEAETSGLLRLGDLQINLVQRQVHRGEREIHLSQREFDLLTYLVQQPERVLARQQILEAVWGQPFVGDPNTLDVYLGYLRRKLERPGLAQLLHTVRGVGVIARVGEIKP
jgi:two-component system response regulator MprA